VHSVEPERLAEIRRKVGVATGAQEAYDRRGFRLLQWPSPHTDRKPIELSLEHEARLSPTSTRQLHSLLASLAVSRGERLDRVLLAGKQRFHDLTLEQVRRAPGP
jgi:hypothetical protein